MEYENVIGKVLTHDVNAHHTIDKDFIKWSIF
jgi:hypothetical protein